MIAVNSTLNKIRFEKNYVNLRSNMDLIIKAPDRLRASVALPASKSISNRVLILNALSPYPQPLQNLSDCDDTKVMLHALQTGMETIDIHASGTAMRFLTAYFSGCPGCRILTGTERMRNRPIRLLAEVLRQTGAQIDYLGHEGFPPLRITGVSLRGGEATIEGGVSSQYLSALLMVAPTMKEGLRLHLSGELVSEPYLRLTIELMRRFGVIVSKEGQTFSVEPQVYRPVPFTVEADWSAASYWYEMAALSSAPVDMELQGLFANSLQGDAEIAVLYERFGVQTEFTPSGVKLIKTSVALPDFFEYDCLHIPDMAQTLAATCAMLHIPFRLKGLQSLKIKETDRLTALRKEMRKLGFVLTEHDGNILEWNGKRLEMEPNPMIDTYDDHRMAMTFAPVALCRNEGIIINDSEVVSKSYPRFWDDLTTAGFTIENKQETSI